MNETAGIALCGYYQLVAVAGGWAAILTAIVAVFGYGKYLFDQHRRKMRLIEYLKSEKQKNEDKGQRTILHLIAKLGMTEAQVLEASFQSGKITRRLSKDGNTGRANEILLEWVG
ncbi:MAG: hypothetical protein ACSHXI_18655 [Hoeflea sp.]|uniref:hypothetical protein n=1 Tax=Hoeflea sp. TaxID=1940281 RepID=UPI003EF9CC4F